jgi:hypothetical protein
LSDLSHWERVLENSTDPDAAPNPYDLKGHTKLALDEIIQGQYFIQDPLIATETQEIMTEEDPNGFNTQFQATIDLVNDPFETFSRNPELNILAFAQLDIKRLKEDFDLNVINGLSEIGSELLYEKCLVYSQNADVNRLVVPEFRKVFFTEDGAPYDGPVHNHRTPTAEGYTGYMSGPPTGDMSNRQKLTVREIPNSKVVSRIFIERALNSLAEPVTETNTYSGYIGPGELIATPIGNLSFGEDILQALRSQSGLISTIGNGNTRDYHENLKKLSLKSIRRGNLNITDPSVPPDDLSWIQINPRGRSYHGSVFLIKVDDILSNNSNFSHIFDLHARGRFFNQSRNIVDSIISASKLQQLTIHRRRLTSTNVGNNLASTPQREIYDTDEIEEHVIRTTSPRDEDSPSFARNSENGKARLQEINPSIAPRKTLILNDYDLFENVNYGWYEYVLDITLEDGIIKYMIAAQERFMKAIKDYSEYVSTAGKPYLDYRQSGYYNGNQFANGLEDQIAREENNSSGNYNISVDDFTDEFKRLSPQWKPVSDAVVDAYLSVYYMLTADPRLILESPTAADLRSSLLLENTTLQSLEFFLDLCLKLKTRLDSIIDQAGNSLGEIVNLGDRQVSPSKGMRFPDKLITLRGSANVRAEAVKKTSVFALPGNISRRTPEPTAVGSFFGLTADTSIQSNYKVKVPRDASTGNFSHQTSQFFEMSTIASPASAETAEEISKMNARVAAAVNRSAYAPPVKTMSQPGTNDDLVMFNEMLSQYGNTTFKMLITDTALSDTSGTENTKSELEEYLSEEMQSAIYESIFLSKNRGHFEEVAEKQYKDLFFKKNALGDLYETVLTLHSVQSSIRSVSARTSYKEKIRTSASSKSLKIQKQAAISSRANGIKDKIFKPYMIDAAEGLVPATGPGQTGIVIYKKDSDILDGVVLVNNVHIHALGNAAPSTPAPTGASNSQRPIRRKQTRNNKGNRGGTS